MPDFLESLGESKAITSGVKAVSDISTDIQNRAVSRANVAIAEDTNARANRAFDYEMRKKMEQDKIDNTLYPMEDLFTGTGLPGGNKIKIDATQGQRKYLQEIADMNGWTQNVGGMPAISIKNLKAFRSHMGEKLEASKQYMEIGIQDLNGQIAGIVEQMNNPEAKMNDKDREAAMQQVTGLRQRRQVLVNGLNALDKDIRKQQISNEGKTKFNNLTDTQLYSILNNSDNAEDREKAKDMLAFRRAQAGEVESTTRAKRDVEAETAEKIKFNETMGKQLAELSTVRKIEEEKVKGKGEVTPEKKKILAKQRMTGNLAKLGNYYLKLDSMGAIVNVDKSSMDNIGASISASGLGQYVGKKVGTDAQSVRNSIGRIIPLIVQDIRQATDMGARGLDSERELDFYMQSASDPTTDIQSNIAAIVVLDEAYGAGDIAKQLRQLTSESLIRQIKGEGLNILNGKGQSGITWDAWYPEAQKANPNASEQELKDYFNSEYGGK